MKAESAGNQTRRDYCSNQGRARKSHICYSPGRFRSSIFPACGGRLNGNSTTKFSTGIRRTNCSGRRHGPIHLFLTPKNTHPLAEEFELSRVIGRRARVLTKSIISV